MTKLLNRKQAADLLAISPRTLVTLTQDGAVPAIRVGRKIIRYSPEALRDFVERSTEGPTVARMLEPSLN